MFAALFGTQEQKKVLKKEPKYEYLDEESSRLRARDENQLLIDGFIKQQKDISIPCDIINLVLLFYHIDWEILKFANGKKGFTVNDDGNVVTKDGWGVATIPVDIKPVTHGIYCWRIYMITNNQPVAWMVAEKRMVMHTSKFKEIGITSVGAFCSIHPKDYRDFKIQYFSKNILQVDLLLDVDAGTLRICAVGYAKVPYEAILNELPIPGLSLTHKSRLTRHLKEGESAIHSGYVPHICLTASGQKASVVQIPHEKYGKPIQDLFGNLEHEKSIQYSQQELNSEDAELIELEMMMW